MMERAYAVIDAEGNVREVTADGQRAVQIAYALSPTRQVQIETSADSGGALSGFGAVTPDKMPSVALRLSQLKRVDWRSVHALSIDEAHKRLLKFSFTRSFKDRAYFVRKFLVQNYKTSKETPERPSIVQGLQLLPFNLVNNFSRRVQLSGNGLCVGSSPECRASCLVYSGQQWYASGINSKKARTEALLLDTLATCRMLVESVNWHQHHAVQNGLEPFIRLNVFSDVPWELVFPDIFAMFPQVRFYDYTKVPGRVTPGNYDLTFSWSGVNADWANFEVRRNRRVAVVFLLPGNLRQRRESDLPKTWKNEQGVELPVVDGDISDVRPRDPAPSWVGLRWKLPLGKGKGQQAPPTFVERLSGSEAQSAPFTFVVPVQKINGMLVATQSAKSEPIDDGDADA